MACTALEFNESWTSDENGGYEANMDNIEQNYFIISVLENNKSCVLKKIRKNKIFSDLLVLGITRKLHTDSYWLTKAIGTGIYITKKCNHKV